MAGQRRRHNNPFAAITGNLRPRRRYYQYITIALLLVLMLIGLMALVQNKPTHELTSTAIGPTPTASPSITASATLPAMFPAPTPEAEPSITTSPPEAFSLVDARDLVGLIIPVAGVQAIELRDTYNEARAEGRTHNAIDIMAPRGAPVLASANGEIVKLFFSVRGGNTIYQMSEDKKYVFYYAHLERYAEGLAQGQHARQSQVIGYVGDTGNAGAGNYHLHFSIWRITDPKHYWDGININPYPILRQSLGVTLPGQSPRTRNQEEQR